MRIGLSRMTTVGLLAFITGSLPAFAQPTDEDRRALKDKILREVEELLNQEEKRVREEIHHILERELGAARESERPAPPPAGREAPAPRARRKESAEAPAKAPGYLGVKVVEVPVAMRKLVGLKEGEGLLVDEVVTGSPAEKAEVRKGDILLEIDGAKVGDVDAVIDDIRSRPAGATLALTVLRSGDRKTLKATLAARKPQAPESDRETRRPPPEGAFRDRVRKYLEKHDGAPGEPREGNPGDPGKDEDRKREKPGDDVRKDDPKEQGDRVVGETDLAETENFLNTEDGKAILKELKAMGIDPGMFLEKDEEGHLRVSRDVREMLRGITEEDLKQLQDLMQGMDEGSHPRPKRRRDGGDEPEAEKKSDPQPDEKDEKGR